VEIRPLEITRKKLAHLAYEKNPTSANGEKCTFFASSWVTAAPVKER
jgi:hypothetical protein